MAYPADLLALNTKLLLTTNQMLSVHSTHAHSNVRQGRLTNHVGKNQTIFPFLEFLTDGKNFDSVPS